MGNGGPRTQCREVHRPVIEKRENVSPDGVQTGCLGIDGARPRGREFRLALRQVFAHLLAPRSDTPP